MLKLYNQYKQNTQIIKYSRKKIKIRVFNYNMKAFKTIFNHNDI